MRITPASSRSDEPEINLTSLIDVVFTLIIFFVVTTTFTDRSALQVDLPKASAGAATAQADPLLIVVDRDGRYFVGGNEVLRKDGEALAAAVKSAAGDDRERPVILRADARTPHQAVVTAMDTLGQLGFVKLSIATTPEAPEK